LIKDIGIYNIFLIVQKNIITIGAADKSDDKMIIFHSLSKLKSKFLSRYNSQSELDYWNGEIQKFSKFKEVIRKVLINGKIGEVKKNILILKSYKKSYLKLLGQEEKKNLEVKEEDYKKALEIKGKDPWDDEKKLPTPPIAQGYLDPHQYKIAHLFTGFKSPEDIATEMKLPVEEIYKVLKELDDLGLLEYIEIV